MKKKCENILQHIKISKIISENKNIDISSLELFLSFMKASQKMLKIIDIHFNRFGISKNKFNILIILFTNPNKDGLTLTELAKEIAVTKSTITGLIDGLESANYIKRVHRKLTDRRKTQIVLTNKGNIFLKKILPDHFERLSNIFSDLSNEKKNSLNEVYEFLKFDKS